MAPSDVNNWMRAIMQDLAELYDGTQSLATLKATTALSAADGSTAVPSVQFTSSTSTGLYRPAADTVGVVTGGTERFRFGSNPIPGGSKNLVINGNFDIWQRGTSFSTGTEFTADRFRRIDAGDSGSASRQAFAVGQTDVPGNPTYYWRGTIGTGDAAVIMDHKIEGVGHGSGVPVTVSLWARASETTGWLDGASGATLIQRYGTGGSTATRVELDGTFQSQAITTSWQKFVATATPASISGKTVGAGNALELYLSTDPNLSSSATLDIAQVQVEYGSVATDFDAGGDIGTILQKCKRYYQRYGASDEIMDYANGHCFSTTETNMAFMYCQEMRANPVGAVSAAGDFACLNASAGVTAVTSFAIRKETKWSCELDVGCSAADLDYSTYLRDDGNLSSYIELDAEL